MPVNHAKEFLKSIHAEALFFNCLLKTLSSYLGVLVSFSKKNFSQKSFQIVSTISGFVDGKIRKP